MDRFSSREELSTQSTTIPSTAIPFAPAGLNLMEDRFSRSPDLEASENRAKHTNSLESSEFAVVNLVIKAISSRMASGMKPTR